MDKICIVLPTYNERENILKLVPQIEEVCQKNNLSNFLVIVDDNSPDGTGRLADQFAEQYGNIRVLHRPGKSGIGSAYKEGFRIAIDELAAGVIFEMDADLSHNPEFIPGFIRKLGEGFDAVVGSRYIPGGRIEGWGVYRRLVSGGANLLARLLVGIKIHDVTSGYRAFKTDLLRSINYQSVKSEGYAFQIEMIYLCQKAGFRVGEEPIIFIDRKIGRSKLSRKEVVRFAGATLRLFLTRLKNVFF